MKKRSFIGSSDGTLAAGQSKRTKSSQACVSCRRHKTRCELLGDISTRANIKCHRCQVLDILCSFETSDAIHIIPQTPRASSTAPVNEDRYPASSVDPLHLQLISRGTKSMTALNAGVISPEKPSEVKIENLVPDPNLLWHILNIPPKCDWSATPILAIQELLKLAPGAQETPAHIDEHDRLDTILPLDLISTLLEAFKSRYEPWISAPTGLTGHSTPTPTPTLDLIRCQVASRDLDPAIAPRLQKLTQKMTLEELLNLPPSTESIEALLIMALWAPFCGYITNESQDPQKSVSTAINIGEALCLPEASVLVKNLQTKGFPHSRIVDLQIEETRFKAHLWLLLSTFESLVCIGTGKPRASRRSDVDYPPINVPVNDGLSNARVVRLGLMAKVMDATEKGCGLRLAGPGQNELKNFYGETHDILVEFDVLKRFIAPTVVSQFEAFQFRILLVQYHICRLLILHHALQEIRRVPHRSEAELYHTSLAISLSRDALGCAQAALTETFVGHDHEQLATAPDYIFWMISFAATWLVTFNYWAYQTNNPKHIDGACDMLLTATIERLSLISRSPNHTPAKCAHLISQLFDAFQRLVRKSNGGDVADPSVVQTNPGLSLPDMTSTPLGYASSGSWDGQALTAAPGNINDLGETFGADPFLGQEFWSSFMNNLPSSPP